MTKLINVFNKVYSTDKVNNRHRLIIGGKGGKSVKLSQQLAGSLIYGTTSTGKTKPLKDCLSLNPKANKNIDIFEG